MQTYEQIAREVYNYMVLRLAEGVDISDKDKKEMLKEIEFLIDMD